MYATSYKTVRPYFIWYQEIHDMEIHIKERCDEIASKYKLQLDENRKRIKDAYEKGEDEGRAYEQHHDEWLDIRLKKNRELISLESEIKSTIEKVLKNMMKTFNIAEKKKEKGSYISFYMKEIETNRGLDMSNYEKEKKDISILVNNRNKSEHESDNLCREIDEKYILRHLNSVHRYVNSLIKELYNNRKMNG